MEGDSLTFLRLKNTEETKELTTQVGVRDQDLQVDQVNDKQIMGVLNSKPPFNVAEIIRKYCPKVLSALKELISEEVTTACQKLCRRSGLSCSKAG